MLAWTLTRPDSHIRAMLAGVAESEITSSLLAVSLMSAGGSSGFASVTGSAAYLNWMREETRPGDPAQGALSQPATARAARSRT